MKHRGLLLLAALLLSACSVLEQPAEPAPADQPVPPSVTEQEPAATPLAAVDSAELCRRYGRRSEGDADAGELHAALVERALFSAAEWRMIEARRVARGMSECALAAAWSSDTARAVNVTFSNGDHGRRLFYDCRQTAAPYCPYTRVDIRAGRVDSVRQSHFLE